MACVCVFLWMSVQYRQNCALLLVVVETRLFYRSVLIPHSLSCWLTDRQHIADEQHTCKDEKKQHAKNRKLSTNRE